MKNREKNKTATIFKRTFRAFLKVKKRELGISKARTYRARPRKIICKVLSKLSTQILRFSPTIEQSDVFADFDFIK